MPEDSDDQLFSGFIQDQISLGDSLRVTLGTKLEHNDFSGFEVQPSVRVAWLPRDNHTLWAAISRAVRVPTRFERDVSVDASDPAGNPVFRLVGNDDFESEELIAYEAGYRWRPLEVLSLDLALFYNDYQELAAVEVRNDLRRSRHGPNYHPGRESELHEWAHLRRGAPGRVAAAPGVAADGELLAHRHGSHAPGNGPESQ